MVKNYKEILYDNANIETERLILRKAVKTDVHDILEYSSDEEAIRYLDWVGANSAEEVLDWIVNYHWSNPGIWVIELKENHKCIGDIDIKIRPEHEKAEFGYMLNRSYWNNGYMTEALMRLIRLAFIDLDLNRVESLHYTGNEKSGRVMEKVGMVYEGTSEQSLKIKDVFRDIVRYGITKEKWLSLSYQCEF